MYSNEFVTVIINILFDHCTILVRFNLIFFVRAKNEVERVLVMLELGKEMLSVMHISSEIINNSFHLGKEGRATLSK